MITDVVLTVLMAPVLGFLSLLPSVDISIPEGAFDWLFSIANAVGYLLPIKTFITILGISMAIKGFQIAWALILRVKSFIPTMGA